MLVHTVFFWLKDELSEEDKADFLNEVKKLADIPDSESTYVGTPAATEKRPVIDDSYDVCLTVTFTDLAAHDRYQVHQLHKDFLDKNASKWTRVQVYDAD